MTAQKERSRAHPIRCEDCIREGSQNGKLKFDDILEFCRWHPKTLMTPPPKKGRM